MVEIAEADRADHAKALGLCGHDHCRAYDYCRTCDTTDGEGCVACDRIADALAQAREAEAARWQARLYDEFRPPSDGSGCESGDPLDVAVAALRSAVERARDEEAERWSEER